MSVIKRNLRWVCKLHFTNWTLINFSTVTWTKIEHSRRTHVSQNALNRPNCTYFSQKRAKILQGAYVKEYCKLLLYYFNPTSGKPSGHGPTRYRVSSNYERRSVWRWLNFETPCILSVYPCSLIVSYFANFIYVIYIVTRIVC